MEEGFIKADSRNLPKVSVDMVVTFFAESAEFSNVEMNGTKLLRSTRESYGDNAISYVQIKREGELCTIKSRVTPEHINIIRKKGYSVTAIINETQGSVQSCKCEDCAASEGGCKHAAALLLWLHRRSEEPLNMSVTCYWKKSKLSTHCASGKSFIKAKEIGYIPVNNSFSQVDILSEYLDAVKEKDSQASILRYFREDQQTMSIHKLCSSLIGKLDSPQSFLEILSKQMTTDNINMIFATTKHQSDSPLCFELMYGRITGSSLHEAAHCRTKIGSLLEKIMGEHSKPSIEVDRGKELKKEVLKVVSNKEKINIEEAGLLLNAEYPIFGATPDGLTENYIVEVKCPSTEATIPSYVRDNKLTKKYWTQVQLQMFFSKRKMALFCIAHPDFEKSKEVDIYNVPFDDRILSVMNSAKEFWVDVVFPRLRDIYNF